MRQVFNWACKFYTIPTAQALARKELEDAKRALLVAQTTREHADASCKYNEARIRRLSAYVTNNEVEQ